MTPFYSVEFMSVSSGQSGVGKGNTAKRRCLEIFQSRQALDELEDNFRSLRENFDFTSGFHSKEGTEAFLAQPLVH